MTGEVFGDMVRSNRRGSPIGMIHITGCIGVMPTGSWGAMVVKTWTRKNMDDEVHMQSTSLSATCA
jgi:hypothetical protein